MDISTRAVHALFSSVQDARFDDPGSNLIAHAKRELKLAGVTEPDSDYDGMLAVAVIDLVRLFAAQGHSGYSAHMTVQLFAQVARFEALTPLTSNPDEWMQHTPDMWQNVRDGECFSNDGGLTYKKLGSDVTMTSVVKS